MDSIKKILIIQSYNPNKGDNSVVGIMLTSLERYGCDISLTAFDPQKAGKDYQIKAYDYLFSFRQAKLASSKWSFIKYVSIELMWLVYLLLWTLLYKLRVRLPLPRLKWGIIEAYINADVVVLPGGHFFTSFNSLPNNFSHYCGLRFAQLIGKKTMVYSQTVGPYKSSMSGRIEQFLAKRVLKRANIVTLREADSLKCYSGKNSCVTAETVFIEPVTKVEMDLSKYVTPYTMGKPIVGVTIHHIYYKHYFSKKDYINKMVEIFDSILSQYDCHILMIPMEDNYKAGGDRPIIKEMMGLIKAENAQRISMVTDDLSSTETANVIALCDIFIGTKTHSVVYGLKTATPTISISYQEKSTEFMKMFGVEDYAIAMDKLNRKDFMEIYARIYRNREQVRETLGDRYQQVKNEAENNNELLMKLVYA